MDILWLLLQTLIIPDFLTTRHKEDKANRNFRNEKIQNILQKYIRDVTALVLKVKILLQQTYNNGG